MADENTRSVDIRIGATADTARGVAAAQADLKSLTAAAARENRAMATDAERAASTIRAKASAVQDNKKLAGLEGGELTLAKAKLTLEKERAGLQETWRKSLALPPDARVGLDAQLIELDRDLVAQFEKIKKDVYGQFARTKFQAPEIIPPKPSATREAATPRGALGQPGGRPPIKVPIQVVDDTKPGLESAKKGIDGFLAQVNERFGRSSTTAKLAKLAAGGGAAFAVKYIAGELSAAADKVSELQIKLQEVPLTTKEIVAESVKIIPIIGTVAEATEKWMGVLSGTSSLIAKNNAEAKNLNETMERATKLRDQARDLRIESIKLRIDQSELSEPLKIKAEADLTFIIDQKKINDLKLELSKTVAAQGMTDKLLGRDSVASKTFAREAQILSAAIDEKQQGSLDARVLAYSIAAEKQQTIDREQAKAARDHEKELNDIRREGARESEDIQDKINTDRLRRSGEGLAAELGLLSRANQRAKEDDLRRAREHEQDTKLSLDQRASAVPEAVGRNRLRDQETEAAIANLRRQHANDLQDIESRIASIRLSGMRESIDAGNKLAAIDAARLQVAEQFAQRRKEIQAILDDPKANAGQKARAEAAKASVTPDKEDAADLRATNNAQFDLIAEQGQLRISILEKEGELGNRAARIEADRLRIKLEYVRLGRQVVDQVQNETERTKILAALGRDMQRDLARAGVRAGESFSASATAPETGGSPNDVLLRLKEELTLKRDPVVEAIDKNSDITSGTNSLLDSIFGWLKVFAPKQNEPAPKPPAATPPAPKPLPPESAPKPVDEAAVNAAKGFSGARSVKQAAQDQADEAERDRPAREARRQAADAKAAAESAASAKANAERNVAAERERAARVTALFGGTPEEDAEIKRKADEAKRGLEDRTKGRISSTDREFVNPLEDPPIIGMEAIGKKIRESIRDSLAAAKQKLIDPLTDPDGLMEGIGNRRRAIPGSEMASADPTFAISQAARFAQQSTSDAEGNSGTQPLTESTGLLILDKLTRIESIGREMKKAVDPVRDIDDLLSNALSVPGDNLRV